MTCSRHRRAKAWPDRYLLKPIRPRAPRPASAHSACRHWRGRPPNAIGSRCFATTVSVRVIFDTIPTNLRAARRSASTSRRTVQAAAISCPSDTGPGVERPLGAVLQRRKLTSRGGSLETRTGTTSTMPRPCSSAGAIGPVRQGDDNVRQRPQGTSPCPWRPGRDPGSATFTISDPRQRRSPMPRPRVIFSRCRGAAASSL